MTIHLFNREKLEKRKGKKKRLSSYRSFPVAAEGQIEHKRLIVEKLAGVASRGGPERLGLAPGVGSRGRIRNVAWDLCPIETPDTDAVIVPELRVQGALETKIFST